MEDEQSDKEEPPKKSKKLLIIGLVLALIGGGGGFFAVKTGLLFGTDNAEASDSHDAQTEALPKVAFVEVDPLVVNLNRDGDNRFLRFRAQLEIDGKQEAEIVALLPRVVDVMNGYLRAVSISDLEAPNALIKLRAQLLRRIQIVTGLGRVHDLLVMEFVIN